MRGKRATIGVLMGNALTIYSEELVEGMRRAAEENDINLLYFLGFQGDLYRFGTEENAMVKQKNDDYQFSTVYDYASFGDVDALVVAYGFLSLRYESHNKEKFLEKYKDIPYVLLNDFTENESAANIRVQNYEGMYQCVEHLIRVHGYTKILHLAGPKGNYEACEREKAYRDAMRDYNLPVEEKMIEYGTYTANVERQVYALIAHNPGFEAIVCGNDDMAKTVYQICKEEGYSIGEDIAVTGFDDFSVAQSMDPPLTTVSQNGFAVGYASVENALSLLQGKAARKETVQTSLRIRQSCGCRQKEIYQCRVSNKEELEFYIEEISALIAGNSKMVKDSRNTPEIIRHQIQEILSYIARTIVTGEEEEYRLNYLRSLLRELVQNRFVSNVIVTEQLCFAVRQMMPLLEEEKDREKLQEAVSGIHTFVHAHDLMKLKTEMEDFKERNSYVPSFVMDPLEELGSEEVVFWDISAKLRATRVKSSYIFIFEKAMEHSLSAKEWEVPDKMYLAAYHNEKEIISYERGRRPVICKKDGLTRLWDERQRHTMVLFSLFSGSRQYGMLACEVNLKNLAYVHIVSLQLGTLLRFLDLTEKEHEIQKKLEQAVKEVKDKNTILNFISDYDEMTGLLNRRGFMERAVRLSKEQEEKRASLIFVDLDHLKQINDAFGHNAGDEAICVTADALRECFGDGNLIARIGGDEFLVMCLEEGGKHRPDFNEELKRRNQESDRPYYVECSMGVEQFRCGETVDIMKLTRLADSRLYEAKKKRRESVLREKKPQEK